MFRWSTSEQVTRVKRCGRAEHRPQQSSIESQSRHLQNLFESQHSRMTVFSDYCSQSHLLSQGFSCCRGSLVAGLLGVIEFIRTPACDGGEQFLAMLRTCVIMRQLAVDLTILSGNCIAQPIRLSQHSRKRMVELQ